jgi:hypothetical protein
MCSSSYKLKIKEKQLSKTNEPRAKPERTSSKVGFKREIAARGQKSSKGFVLKKPACQA